MSALLIGFLLVVVSAALFGAALFGHRPIPQRAMAGTTRLRGGGGDAESVPSHVAAGYAQDHMTSADVQLSAGVRVRSALLLGLAMLGTAVIVGAILSILVVGAVLVLA